MSQNRSQSWQTIGEKIKQLATTAGRELVEKALMLFYAAQRPETPLWAKTIIYSSLVYLVLPADAIPDFLPVAGYTDDLTTLATALGAVALSITPEVQTTARQQVNSWFGDPEAPTSDREVSAEMRVIDIE